MCKIEIFYFNASFDREYKIIIMHKVFTMHIYVWMKSCKKCRSKFESQFPGFRINLREVICCDSTIL